MNGTSGLTGYTEFKSAALQRYLESKLRADQALAIGSTRRGLAWKEWTTPSGARYCRLSPPGRSTSANGSGLLPTLAARDYRYPNAKPYQARGGGNKGEQLPNAIGGPVNPMWGAWHMGYPTAFLNCAPLATRLCRKSRRAS